MPSPNSTGVAGRTLRDPLSRLLTSDPVLRASLWPFDVVGGWMIRAQAAEAARTLPPNPSEESCSLVATASVPVVPSGTATTPRRTGSRISWPIVGPVLTVSLGFLTATSLLLWFVLLTASPAGAATVSPSPDPTPTVTETVTAAPTATGPLVLDAEQFQAVLYALGVLGFLLALHVVRSWGDRS